MRLAIPILACCALAACAQPQEDSAETEAPAVETPAATGTATAAGYDGPIPLPIKVGGDGPDMDACGTYAEVGDLLDTKDGFLYVHDAPSETTKARHRFSSGQGVAVCQTQNGFSGVVYPGEGQTLSDCGTGSPVATEQNYTGPCRAGWVESRYLEMIAG